jgi:hypothetical protein
VRRPCPTPCVAAPPPPSFCALLCWAGLACEGEAAGSNPVNPVSAADDGQDPARDHAWAADVYGLRLAHRQVRHVARSSPCVATNGSFWRACLLSVRLTSDLRVWCCGQAPHPTTKQLESELRLGRDGNAWLEVLVGVCPGCGGVWESVRTE